MASRPTEEFRSEAVRVALTIGQPHRAYGLHGADRRFHMYVVGQTGTGKSSLLGNLLRQDAEQGQGFCLIDPHGDLAASVAELVAERATYWNVADPACPYGYNPLTQVSAERRPLVSSGLI